jgi:hypothetical protein
MAVYLWKQTFTDVRICGVEADSKEEAIKKRDEGDWLFEDTIDFYTQERDDFYEVTDE